MPSGLPLALAAALLCSPPGRAIVAEVYYDALGDDTGREFVELFNPGGAAVGLNGARLESGDGAGPGRWTSRWTGVAGDSIPAGGRFVVGGAMVEPAPDRVVNLELQNGPDAVRLVWPDGAIEVVGWGALAFPEYSCGAPAPDVASGLSLARIPDGTDGGGNALDFRPATPSPGRANQARRNLAVIAGSLRLDPERPDPGVASRLEGRIANLGADTIRVGDLDLRFEVEAVATALPGPRWPAAATRAAPPVIGPLEMLPGDTLGFEQGIAGLAAGKHRLWVTATVPGDEHDGDDRDSLRFRVGPGPFAITEIQFHPADGEGEWVEIGNRSESPLDPAAFTLSDRGAARGVPRDGFGTVAPESLAVLAQDRVALLAAFPGLDAARVWQVSPWSALNNTDDTSGVADRVVLRDADGIPAEAVAYRAAGVPAGVPLEWREGTWQVALDPRGTPLAPPRALPPAARRFDLRPARVSGDGGLVRLEWALPWPRARLRADLYDLDGRRVGELLGERSAPGRGSSELALRGIPPGVYWAVLEARAPSGPERVTEARPLRVVGRP